MFSPVLVSSNVVCFGAEASSGMSRSDWRSDVTASAKTAALTPAQPPPSGVGLTDEPSGRMRAAFLILVRVAKPLSSTMPE